MSAVFERLGSLIWVKLRPRQQMVKNDPADEWRNGPFKQPGRRECQRDSLAWAGAYPVIDGPVHKKIWGPALRWKRVPVIV